MLAFRRLSNNIAGDLYVLSLSDALQPTAEPSRITHINKWISNPIWTSDSTAVLFTSEEQEGNLGIYRVGLSGQSGPGRISILSEDGAFLAISHRAHRLAYSRLQSDYDIWRVDLRGYDNVHSSGIARNEPISPLISSTQDDYNPQYSPRGDKIAFQSRRSGTNEIWVADADGSNCKQLTSMRAQLCGFPHWSPDGSEIASPDRTDKQISSLFLLQEAHLDK
jgi:Tol biopolymer transport system component